jgi:3-oxoacyl-[acyl-carrier-protein] synthase II
MEKKGNKLMNRVVITGIGVSSPIGSSYDEFMNGIEKARQGINHIENFNTDLFPVDFGAEVKENGIVYRTDLDVDRKEVFINKAMEELFDNNDFINKYSPADRFLYLGTGIDYFNLVGYVNSDGKQLDSWSKHCKRSYTVVEKLLPEYEIDGGFYVNVSACVASTQAMGLSYRMIKNVRNKIVITGGFDSMLCNLHYMGFYKLGALSNWDGRPEEACRPFDKNRCGLVLGEGGVVFSLQNENEADPDAILAEIVGYSSTLDAYLVTDPDPMGRILAKSALQAIEEAGITPDDIDCVHLHGTGTVKNALAEAKAMEIVFSDRYKEIPVFSLKGQIGHLIGACGAMEIIGVIYSLLKQEVPPTVNFKDPDPEVPLRVIKDKPLNMEINYILKLNSGFGGQNTAFVIKRYGK